MTDNPIKEALEEAIEEYMGALRGKLQKAYREQIGLKLEKAEAALALIEKGEEMWSGTSEEGVTSYYPQDFAAEYIERTTGVKMTKVLVIPLEQEQSE